MREAMLSLLAKEPAHGYELRQRLVKALGPAGGALNPGQVYVTLSRLERSGLVKANEVATSDILRLFAGLREARQTLLIVTHDAWVASSADRLLTMRDGAIVAQTRLGAGTSAAGAGERGACAVLSGRRGDRREGAGGEGPHHGDAVDGELGAGGVAGAGRLPG
jgi:Fe2+ or Zn2+ uptake regulation protein